MVAPRIIGWVLLLAMANAGAVELRVAPSADSVAWGRFLRVEVITTALRDLGPVPTQAWEPAWVVETVEREVGRNELDEVVAVDRLRLHPRAVGPTTLAPLQVAGARSRTLALTVRPPSLRRAQLTVTTEPVQGTPYAGEQLRVMVKIGTRDKRAGMALAAPDDDRLDTELMNIRTMTMRDGRPWYQHRVGWILFARQAGALQLSLPPIRYQVSGGDLRRFYLPRLNLDVRPVPSYMPPTVPVGSLDISSAMRADGEPGWLVEANTDGRLVAGLPELRGELAALAGNSLEAVQETVHSAFDGTAWRTTLRYRVPAPPLLVGVGQSLPLSTRYFDPARGRIVTLSHSLPRFWHLDKAWWPWAVLAGLALVLFGVWFARGAIQRWRHRRSSLCAIRRADTARQCREIVLAHFAIPSLAELEARHVAVKPLTAELDRLIFAPRIALAPVSAARRAAREIIQADPNPPPTPSPL